MDRLKEIADILIKDDLYYDVIVEDNEMQIEEEWEDNGCKNDDDCTDYAHEFASEVIERFPELELKETFCHRHKYSMAVLKLKTDEVK